MINEKLGYTGLRRDLFKWLQGLYAQGQATYYSCESIKRDFVKIKAEYPLMRALAMQASARAANDVVGGYVESREELYIWGAQCFAIGYAVLSELWNSKLC